MRLRWNRIWSSLDYQRGTVIERRMLELRFSLAQTLRQLRKRRGLTQQQFAEWIGAGRGTVSRMESADTSVTLDQIVMAMLALDAPDEEIADAFNAGRLREVQSIRALAAKPLALKPTPGFVRSKRRRKAGFRAAGR
jgi:transcriptional regulator with XRE-family HTH domain